VLLLLALVPAAFAQIQLIQNGGFASASYAPWVLTGSGITFGSGYLSMGNYSGATQSAYQTVTFPTNLIGATLSLYYQTISTDPNGDDTLTIDIADTNNNVLEELGYTTSAYTNGSWSYASTNFITYPGSNTLSSYAGQTVNLLFAVTTDASYGNLTSFDITDVSLLAGTTANIPANDNLANATVISTNSYTNVVTNTYASKEPGEPNHAGNAGGHSVWWTWTAPAIGMVKISTTNSGFETLLAVYTNSAPANLAFSNLTCVSSNNGANRSSGRALVQFTVPTEAQVGTQYYVALDGYNGASGSAELNFYFSTNTTPPAVSFSSPANAAAVTNSSVLVTGKASDDVAVAIVEYSLTNAAGAGPWLTASTTNQWTNWFATVTNLIPGSNTVVVEAYDTSSNLSTLESREFNYDIPVPLALSTNGRGSIVGATNGQRLDLAFPYTLTAKPAPGFGFNGWSGSSNTASSNLTFIMASNLSFTANFVDVQKPTNSIISPAPGQRWSNSLFQVTGKAVDNVAVAAVFYQLNGSNWVQASTTNSWTNWYASVTLAAGSNNLRAYAVDTSTNFSTPTNSVGFFYIVTAPLVVQTNGRGTFSPDYNGQSLAIGSNYSMTAAATPGSGFAFTNWTGGTNLPFGFLTNNSKLTFTMESNLTLVASFVDVTPPSITVTSPTANLRWSNSTFTATGTAKDNVQVSNVLYQLNGGAWMAASPSNVTWSNWTAVLTNLQSTNVFEAFSVDTTGNKSPTNKVSFLYVPSAVLTVQTNGLGGITPVENGKLLAIGTNYTLTAAAGHNWLFSNWEASGGENFISNNPVLSFKMQSNLVLSANFVTNPFLAVAGGYNGLFCPDSGVTEDSSGFVSVTILSNSAGAYSAKLLLDGASNSFSGSFDLTGTSQTNLTVAGQKIGVTLLLDFNPAAAFMGGSISNAAAGWNSPIQADRAAFSATANPATNYAGKFTLLLPPGPGAPLAGPDGYGYAAITNTLGGVSTLGGALADGTPFLWSAPISQNGGVPFYQSLYSGGGSLMGWIYFTNEPPQNISTNSSLNWIKPAVPKTLYPQGFTNFMTNLPGSPYTNTANEGVPVLNLSSATLLLTNGNLTNGFLIYTNIGTNLASRSTLTNLDAGNTNLAPTNHLVIAINTTNGLVTLTFQATGGKSNTVAHGAVLQNQTNALGAFLGTNQTGSFILH
jgi:hypothetical protein